MTTSGRANAPRDGKGRFRRDLEHVQRDAQAAALISQGWTYDAVATELGYTDRGSCWRAVQTVLIETARGTRTEDLRLQQLAELDALKQAMWQTVLSPPPLADRIGHIVRDDDGREVPDEQARTAAAQVIIRAGERISRLRGLDAPRKSVTAMLDIPLADLQATTQQMREEYAAQLGITLDELEVLEARQQIVQAQAVLDRHGAAGPQRGGRVLPGAVEAESA
jgi:hypothetical protein